MLLLTKKYLALAAAVMTVAGLSTGCSQKQTPTGGNAKVAVTASAVVIADVNHIDLAITGGAGEAGFPITATLSKASSGKEWTANITNIPAGAGRLFHAVAYKNPGTAAADKIFEGEATATITAGVTAQVTIILQELNVPPGSTNYAPAITSITSSNAYVVPGTRVSFAVGANDPDHNGDPLHTAWSASCTAGGNGTFSAATSASTDWTAPAQNATCTITIAVTESATFPPAIPNNNGNPLSVSTFFTVIVNGSFGNVDVAAFPNSFPIVTAHADIRYEFSADVSGVPVGQQADFVVNAIDPDGDNVRYDLKAQCGSDLVAAASALALDPSYFTTTRSVTVTPSSWLPKFGVAPAATYTNPYQDCVFTITVQDLCTAGNCGGALADGADKATQIAGVEVKSVTTVIINATHPAQPRRAPSIVRVSAPNQLGPAIPPTARQGWDAANVVIVDPSTVTTPVRYTFSAEAADPFELGTLSVAWSCDAGSAGTPVNTANLKSEMTWTAPASLAAGMTCAATFTSSASGLSTVATFKLSGSDPCLVNGWLAGHACSTGNACLTGETCQASGSTTLCGAGSAVVCPGGNAQCQEAVCNSVTGCGIANLADTVACNADSNGCTQTDHCSAGACVAGAAVTCNTPADAQCQSAAGTCNSITSATFACVYPSIANGTHCNADSNGCTQNDACASGACTAGTPVTCTQSVPCQDSTGTCSSSGPDSYACNFASVPDTTTCNTAGLCVTGQTCLTGTCQGGTPTCPSGQSCIPATGACLASVVAPVVARDLQLSPPSGIAMDSSGNTFVAGNIFTNVDVNFQTRAGGLPVLNVKSLGGIDGFLAKYDAAGDITWAVTVADDDPVSNSNDQTVTSAAVAANGTVATIGKIVGSVTYGSSTNSAASALPYVGAFASADGARLWAKGYNLGSNGAFRAVAASAMNAQNRIAVCGSASIAATQLVPGTPFGGLTDLVIAVFDSNGNKVWAAQLGGAGNESCTSVTIDDNGDVYAAGQFDGASLTFPGATPIALTGPGTTTRKFMWVAKFAGAGNGTGGASTLAAVAYNGTLGTVTPNSLAIGPSGDLVVGGQFAGNLTVGAPMTVAGGDDAFVAKLDGITLAPAWNAVRFGGTGLDLVKSVAVTSFGDIVVTGTFNPSTTAFKTANGGFDTNGAVSLNTSGTTASDMFVAKFNGGTGATDFAAAYGDPGTQNGDGIVANRFGGNQITFVGTLSGNVTFGAAGAVAAAGGTDTVLVFSHLQ